MRNLLMLSAAVLLLSPAAQAWGPDGHRMIASVAVSALPSELPAFVRTQEAADEAGYLAPEADRVKGAGKTFDDEHSPAHFADVADDLTLGGIALKALPVSRGAYAAALVKAGTTDYREGYLPYAIEEGFQRLSKDFAYWRVAAWGEKNAPTAEERAWYAKDRLRREEIVRFDLGTWSHFVGDASQPMHATVHFNGWGKYPNPEGFTDAKVHGPFESEYIHGNITEKDIAKAMPAYRDCHCDIAARTADYLTGTQAEVVPFYRLEKKVGLAKKTPEMNAFVAKQLGRGAAEMRDMIVDAWHHSLDLSVAWPEAKVKDVLGGKADPYEALTY